MSAAGPKPVVTLTRVGLVVSAGLSAGAGLQLFFGSEQTDRYFAWTIQPSLTAAFLGASYLGATVLIAGSAAERLWANARLALYSTLSLVVLLFVVTLVHIDRFHTGSDDAITLVGTWIFITTYGWLPLLLVAALVVQFRAPGGDPPRVAPLPGWMRGTLAVQAAVMIGFGIAFLLAPLSMARTWPWELTALTGRALGAWLFSVGFAAALAFVENDVARLRSAFAAYVALAVLNTVAVARYSDTPDWSHAGSWALVAMLATMLVVGAAGLRSVLALRRGAAAEDLRPRSADTSL